MALGELTKQIAQQAILSATTREPAGPAPPDHVCGVFLAQINAMQKALKDDEELVVLFHSGAERIRVMEIFAPSRQVAVLSGTDSDRNHARVISAVESLQLVCKVSKVPPGAKPVRVALITPKPKDSSA
jgi:hypothetical protein